MLDKLREISRKLLKENEHNEKAKNKYQLINNILMNDQCFFEMPYQDAINILKDLGVKDSQIGDIYAKIINIENMRDEI